MHEWRFAPTQGKNTTIVKTSDHVHGHDNGYDYDYDYDYDHDYERLLDMPETELRIRLMKD